MAKSFALNVPPAISSNLSNADFTTSLGKMQLGGGAPPKALSKTNLPMRPKTKAAAPVLNVPSLPVSSPALPATPTTAADLAASTDVQLTPEIKALATTLNHDPLRIYEYVRNNCDFEPYYTGSLKGSQETLLQKKGNDFDLASLQIALLRASNIPAKYGRGTVTIPAAQALSWIGVTDLQTAADLMRTAGYDASILSAPNNIQALQVSLVWVEAAVPGGTLGTSQRAVFLPAYKLHSVTPGRKLADEAGVVTPSIDTLLGFAETDASVPTLNLMDQNGFSELALNVADQVQDYVAQGQITPNQAMGTKQIQPETYTALPQLLPLDVILSGVPSNFSTVATADRRYVRFQTGGLDVTLPMPEIASQQVTLSFAGGNWKGLQPGAVTLTPQIKVGGQVKAQGTGVPVGYYYGFAVDFMQGTTFIDRTIHTVTTGGHYSVSMNTQNVSPKKFKDAVTNAHNAASGAAHESDQVLGGLLHSLGLFYFAQQDVAAKMISANTDAVTFHDVNEALLGSDLILTQNGLCRGGYSIDAPRTIVASFSRTGAASFKSRDVLLPLGFASSSYEHGIFEFGLGIPSTSTVRGFEEAINEDVPIYGVNSANLATVIPKLNQPQHVIDAITESANNGLRVIIPKEPILTGRYYGTCWLAFDPTTGAGGFMLSGGSAGGSTVLLDEDLLARLNGRSDAQGVDLDMITGPLNFLDAFVGGAIAVNYDDAHYGEWGPWIGQQSGKLLSSLTPWGVVVNLEHAGGELYSSGGESGKIDMFFSTIGAWPLVGKAFSSVASEAVEIASEELSGVSAEAGAGLESILGEEANNFFANAARNNITLGDFIQNPMNGIEAMSASFSRATTAGSELAGEMTVVGKASEIQALSESLGVEVTAANKGAFMEAYADKLLQSKGLTPLIQKGSPNANGLDGLYRDAAGKIYAMEAKFVTSDGAIGLGSLKTTLNNTPVFQLGEEWTQKAAENALNAEVVAQRMTQEEASNILDQITTGQYNKVLVSGRQAATSLGRGKTLTAGLINNLEIGGASSNPIINYTLDMPPGSFPLR